MLTHVVLEQIGDCWIPQVRYAAFLDSYELVKEVMVAQCYTVAMDFPQYRS
jgi:hypothetical protein